jgi:hypothetical protein
MVKLAEISKHTDFHTMNLRLISLVLTLVCAFFASCSPYDERPKKKPIRKTAQNSVTSPAQQNLQQKRDELKAKQEAQVTQEAQAPTEQIPTNIAPPGNSTQPAPTITPPPAPEVKRPEYKFANKVPGKDGFVFSPYNNKVVDVRDIPSGTLVQDPTYTGDGKGYFRVP